MTNEDKKNLIKYVDSNPKIYEFLKKLIGINFILKSDYKYMYLVSMISSDNSYDEKSANESLEELKFLKNNINLLDIDDETYKEVKKYINKGLKIIKRDLKEYKE